MKILAVSSIGGHWIQLLRLRPAFAGAEVEFMSTKPSFSDMVPEHKFHCIPDSNRWDKVGLFESFFKIAKIIKLSKPDVIITTGASPGLIAIFIGRLMGIKTIWVDSIANCERISMSGKLAKKFANKVYTQWEHLKTDKIVYEGNVLG